MISKRTMPVEGNFLALWPQDGFINTANLEWKNGELQVFNNYTEYWEAATKENGWYGLEDAYYLITSDFK